MTKEKTLTLLAGIILICTIDKFDRVEKSSRNYRKNLTKN